MTKVALFGLGMRGVSPVISAQRRINCYAQIEEEQDKSKLSLIGSPGLTLFVGSNISGPSRCLWPVNSLTTPLLFTLNSGTLYSITNAGIITAIGTIGTTSGDASMVDDGTFLMLVDGSAGYTYNMLVPAGLNQIVDGNFTAHPKTVTWDDTYFIVNDALTNQWQASANGDPTTWPATQINFTGNAGALQAVLADHSLVNIYGPKFTEFWQDTGSADNPYARIPGSGQEFGLKSAWSLAKFDNSMVGLFADKQGAVRIGRMSGFRPDPISTQAIDYILQSYTNTEDAVGYAYTNAGHPMYQISFPTANATLEYDGRSKSWGERQDATGNRYWGNKFANLVNRKLVSDYRNGNIYQLDDTVYTDNGSTLAMEIWSKHIWSDDKYISIDQLQIDIEQGVGTVMGQGVAPQMMLEVSKDGGRTFKAISWSNMGALGHYTQRCIWHGLGAARDWVLKLRVTDPVKRCITGATANVTGGAF